LFIQKGMIDWITGEKFVGVADFVYYPEGVKDCNPLVNTFCYCDLKETNIVYTHTMYVRQLFDAIRKLKSKFIVVTHNCDENVNDASILPDNVIKWYSQNVNVNHPRIQSIPIGLENDKWFKNLHKKDKMEAKLRMPKNNKNLVYLNSNVKTNPKERQPLYDLFEKKRWVTSEKGVNGKGFDEYIDNIYNHKFVFCPDGNGIDTHRLWETLYLGSIPIVRMGVNVRFYSRLPILYVDRWKDVDEGLLNDMFHSFEKQVWDKDMLTFEYWKNKILYND